MTRRRLFLALVVFLSCARLTDLHGQQPAPQPAPSQPGGGSAASEPVRDGNDRGQRRAALVPLQIDVVISRFQGEKKLSSLPYTLAVNANGGNAQLNMGTDVPVPSRTFSAVSTAGKDVTPLQSFNYRSIGTSIDCRAVTADDGRFEVQLSIDDSSLYTSGKAMDSSIVSEMPVFRNFKSRNSLLLKDGQSRQYTAATDRVSSEVVKIDVTLRLVK